MKIALQQAQLQNSETTHCYARLSPDEGAETLFH